MVTASDLKTGMVLRQEGQLYQVLSAELHLGGGKMGGVEHIKLRNLATGAVAERRLRPDERLEVVEVERQRLEYLYQDGEFYVFMNPQSYEQVPIHADRAQRSQGLAPRASGIMCDSEGLTCCADFLQYIHVNLLPILINLD